MRTKLTVEPVLGAAGESEHCREMTSGGVTHDGDSFGIDPEADRVGPNPADRRLAIVNLRRPASLPRQAVADTRTDETTGAHQ